MSDQPAKFDPNRYLIKVQGNRMYLPVSARLIWFRNEHPDWGIETESLFIDPEKQCACFRTKIYDADGRLMACGTKFENVRGFPDYIEKSETGSVGRALALCGYGTQFAPELDEDHERSGNAQNQQRGGQQKPPAQQARTQQAQARTCGEQPSAFNTAVRDKANVAQGGEDASGIFEAVQAFESAMPVQTRNRAKSEWAKTRRSNPHINSMDAKDLHDYLAHLKQFTDGVSQ